MLSFALCTVVFISPRSQASEYLALVSSAGYNFSAYDHADFIAIDTEGNYVLAGGALTIKTGCFLNFISSAVFPGVEINGVAVDSGNNIIVAGTVNSGGNEDFVTIKYDKNLIIKSSDVFNWFHSGRNESASKVGATARTISSSLHSFDRGKDAGRGKRQ